MLKAGARIVTKSSRSSVRPGAIDRNNCLDRLLPRRNIMFLYGKSSVKCSRRSRRYCRKDIPMMRLQQCLFKARLRFEVARSSNISVKPSEIVLERKVIYSKLSRKELRNQRIMSPKISTRSFKDNIQLRPLKAHRTDGGAARRVSRAV
jgi:hypothetical protein